MRYRRSLTILAAAALVSFEAAPLYGQAEQEHAALCGRQSNASQPTNIHIASDESDGVSYVRLDALGATKTLTLPGVERIQGICPVAGNRIVIFGALASGASAAYEVAIADAGNGVLLDSWDAYTPVMSPDQRWLILRKFYPPQTALTVSEEYLLYPAWKIEPRGAPRNRNAEPPSAAIVVYPPGQTNTFMSNLDVRPEQAHVFRSKSFFWSEDSRAVVFADSVQGRLSTVLVQISDENPTALVYPLSADDVCESSPSSDISTAMLVEADVSPEGGTGGREIQMRFEASSSGCKPKPVVLRTSDFQRPKAESHPIRSRKPSTPAEQQ